MKKNSIFLSITIVALIFFCSAAFAQETFTLVTYYPAPFGVYREMQVRGNDNANIISGLARNYFVRTNPGNSAGIIMVDTADGHPQIQFQNQAFTGRATNNPDFSIGLVDDNNFWIVGGQGATTAGLVGNVGPGTVTIASRDNANPVNIVPGRIRVGEIWFCSNY